MQREMQALFNLKKPFMHLLSAPQIYRGSNAPIAWMKPLEIFDGIMGGSGEELLLPAVSLGTMFTPFTEKHT